VIICVNLVNVQMFIKVLIHALMEVDGLLIVLYNLSK